MYKHVYSNMPTLRDQRKVSPATLFWGEASFFLLPYDAGRLGGLQVSRQLSPIPVNPIKVLGWQVCTTRSRLLCEFQESCMPALLSTEHFTRLKMRVRGPQTHITVLTLMGSGGKAPGQREILSQRSAWMASKEWHLRCTSRLQGQGNRDWENQLKACQVEAKIVEDNKNQIVLTLNTRQKCKPFQKFRFY